MQGLFAMEIMGFGWLLVSGLSLVPWPPAMITAFIEPPLPLDDVRGPSYTESGRGIRFL
jgi:hypothetical protein